MAKAKAPAETPYFDIVQTEEGAWSIVCDGEPKTEPLNSRVEAALLAAELAKEAGGMSKGANIYRVVANEVNDWDVVLDGKVVFTSPNRVVAVDTATDLAESNNGTVND